MWKAFTTDRDQEVLDEREALTLSLEAGIRGAPTQYELHRLKIVISVLQAYGVTAGSCSRMTAIVTDLQDLTSTAAGSCFWCGPRHCDLFVTHVCPRSVNFTHFSTAQQALHAE